MKSIALFAIASFFSFAQSFAQDDCVAYMPPEGTTLVYHNFDKKGKVTGITTTEVKSVIEKEDGRYYKIHQLISDGKKKKNDMEMDLTYKCKDNKFIVDMQSILIAEQMQSLEGGTVVVETEDMYFPAVLEPGMELNDGRIKMDASVEYMTMTINVRSFYRKVEGQEEVETPAGKFTAWKINGNIESKFGFMRAAFKTVEWYVPDVGVVKSESYDNKGKMIGSTELQSITN